MQCRILHETKEEIITTINHNDMQANKQAQPLQKLGTHHQNTRLIASSLLRNFTTQDTRNNLAKTATTKIWLSTKHIGKG
jgi:hypothetical protein